MGTGCRLKRSFTNPNLKNELKNLKSNNLLVLPNGASFSESSEKPPDARNNFATFEKISITLDFCLLSLLSKGKINGNMFFLTVGHWGTFL